MASCRLLSSVRLCRAILPNYSTWEVDLFVSLVWRPRQSLVFINSVFFWMSNYDTCNFRLFDCLSNPRFDEDQAILNDTMARGDEHLRVICNFLKLKFNLKLSLQNLLFATFMIWYVTTYNLNHRNLPLLIELLLHYSTGSMDTLLHLAWEFFTLELKFMVQVNLTILLPLNYIKHNYKCPDLLIRIRVRRSPLPLLRHFWNNTTRCWRTWWTI